MTENTDITIPSTLTGVEIDLNGHTVTLGSGYSLTNNGNLEIINTSDTNGSITGSVINGTIINNGTLTLGSTSNSGDMTVRNTRTYVGDAISNSGTIIINSANIYSNGTAIVNQAGGIITMNDGYIHGAADTAIINNGTITMIGGTVYTSSYDGIDNRSGSVLTLGINDGIVSTSNPSIQSSDSIGAGVYVRSGATFNYYDGIIKGKGTGKSINGTITNIPTGYQVYKETVDGVESAWLVNPNNPNNGGNLAFSIKESAFSIRNDLYDLASNKE